MSEITQSLKRPKLRLWNNLITFFHNMTDVDYNILEDLEKLGFVRHIAQAALVEKSNSFEDAIDFLIEKGLFLFF